MIWFWKKKPASTEGLLNEVRTTSSQVEIEKRDRRKSLAEQLVPVLMPKVIERIRNEAKTGRAYAIINLDYMIDYERVWPDDIEWLDRRRVIKLVHREIGKRLNAEGFETRPGANSDMLHVEW